MGQKPIEGSNPSLSAIKKSQKKQDPAEEWKQRKKTGSFLLPAYCQLCTELLYRLAFFRAKNPSPKTSTWLRTRQTGSRNGIFPSITPRPFRPACHRPHGTDSKS